MPVKLVDVIRGNVIESTHRGDIAIVSSDGNVLYELGDIERLTYFRSSAKPFQALAVLETGIAEKYKLDLKEIAVMAASHSGEKEHIEVLKGIMNKLEVSEEALICGAHEPVNKDAARELAVTGQPPSKLHCNCSGKHLGIIAAAKAKQFPIGGYEEVDHPIQKLIDKVISDFSEIDAEKIVKGIDGCGIPVHAVPLKNMALAYAHLCDEEFMEGKYRKSQNYVLSAMTMYPEMVAGKGRLDTQLMKIFGDRVIGKIGADGVYCVGILGKSTGIAIKIEDGSSRAVGPAILETLVQLKVICRDEMEQLRAYWQPIIYNYTGDKVGEIKPNFKLK